MNAWHVTREHQLNWLEEVAGDLAHEDSEGTAEEKVTYWLKETSGVPEWFDDHDRSLLIEWVDDSLRGDKRPMLG